MPELRAVVEGLARAVAVIAILVMAGALVVFAQAASPRGTPPAEIERPEPTAKPTKNPYGMHHHFDVRHPHRSTRPKIQNPGEKPD